MSGTRSAPGTSKVPKAPETPQALKPCKASEAPNTPRGPQASGAPEASEAPAYLYDGTLEGLLTCIFFAYANHENPCDLMPQDAYQPRLGQDIRFIQADAALAERVHAGICRACGPAGFSAVRSASLSSNPHAGGIIYRFVRLAMTQNRPHSCRGCANQGDCLGAGRSGLGSCPHGRQHSTLNDIGDPTVASLHELVREVSNEAERMRQFIRFEHMENDVWFARCNPKANVVPVIMPHFAARFNTQPFIIFDENRQLAGISEHGQWQLVRSDELSLPAHAPDEEPMRRAWKRFYDAVSVESRYHPELRRQFMPKRLWRNITEMQEELPQASEKTLEGAPARPYGSAY